MFDQLKRYLGLKAKDGEKDETAVARFDALHAAFPNDPERVKAEFDAGHNVSEAVQSMREKHAADLKAAVDESVTLKAQLVAAQADVASVKKSMADVKADVAARPAVIVSGAGDIAADPGAAYDGSKELQSEFGSKAAFVAYMQAHSTGRARIMQTSKTTE